jgi:hypothetical protein
MGFNLGKFLGNAVKACGKPFQAVGHALQAADGAITKEIDKIPVIGKPLGAIFDAGFIVGFGPAMATAQVLDGKRIDQAIVGQLKQELKDVKEVAPYAEMVLSLIPGIGTGISAALAGGLALASGQPLSSAMMDAVTAAVPGGEIAKMAIDVGIQGVQLAASGKHITWENLAQAGVRGVSAGAGLPPIAQNAIVGAIQTAGDLAKGEKADIAVGDGLADTASTYLGKAGASALRVGIALAHAKFLQNAQAPQITSSTLKNKLMSVGQGVQTSDPTVAAARNNVAVTDRTGFDVGIGTSRMTVDTNQLVTLRGSLNPQEQQGFDHAMSLHIGRVTNPSPVKFGLTTSNGQAGYFTTMGMQGAEPITKQAMMTHIVANQVSKIGASVAVDQINWARMGILGQFWEWLKSVF